MLDGLQRLTSDFFLVNTGMAMIQSIRRPISHSRRRHMLGDGADKTFRQDCTNIGRLPGKDLRCIAESGKTAALRQSRRNCRADRQAAKSPAVPGMRFAQSAWPGLVSSCLNSFRTGGMRRSRPRRLPERSLLLPRDAPTVFLRSASRTNCRAIDLLQWISMLQDRRGSVPPLIRPLF